MVRALILKGIACAAVGLQVCLPSAVAARDLRGNAGLFTPVLIYHHVKPLRPTDNAIERGLTVEPRLFETQLSYLRQHRYTSITAAQLGAHLMSGVKLPRNPVVLTFDDGYVDMYDGVYRRLRARHMTATFFIVPGFLNTPRYLSWSQVLEMARHGMDIEAHTMTHPDLTTLAPNALRRELVDCRRILTTRLHRAINEFAYPYGAFNALVTSVVAQAGYRLAFTTRQGWWQSRAEKLVLPRVYVDGDDTASIFGGRLSDNSAVLAQDPT